MGSGISRISTSPQSPETAAKKPASQDAAATGFGKDTFSPADRPQGATLLPPSRDVRGVAAVRTIGKGHALPLNSMEFKMLLSPEFFDSEKQGVSEFWELVHRTAKHQGLDVEDSSLDPSTRYIAYLDTPDFALNRQGYILRMRQKDSIDLIRGQCDKVELALKFRSPDRELSASKDVSAAEGLEEKSKFEKDVVSGKDSLRDIFSKSSKIEVQGCPGETLGDYAELYPPLEKLGISSSTSVSEVNDRRVKESLFKPGTLKLADGVKSTASIVLWSDQDPAPGEQEPFIAEFCFNFSADEDVKPGQMVQAESAARSFMAALRRNASAWAYEGGTKTELIYGSGHGGEEG